MNDYKIPEDVEKVASKEIQEIFNDVHSIDRSRPIEILEAPSVTEFYKGACEGMHELETVIFGDNLKFIGIGCFRDCTNLKSVELPNSLVLINNLAFANCTSLTELKIPELITVIKDQMCIGCTNLEKVVLPVNLQDIHLSAFLDCPKLTLEQAVEDDKKTYMVHYSEGRNPVSKRMTLAELNAYINEKHIKLKKTFDEILPDEKPPVEKEPDEDSMSFADDIPENVSDIDNIVRDFEDR